MHRSRTTSTPRSGLRSSERTSSRSSMIFVATPRRSSSSSRSFSSTRTRERSTPTVVLLTPVFFGLRSERERDRRGRGHLELRTAVGTRDDLALHGVDTDGHLGVALWTLARSRHRPRPSSAGEGTLAEPTPCAVLVQVHPLVRFGDQLIGQETVVRERGDPE